MTPAGDGKSLPLAALRRVGRLALPLLVIAGMGYAIANRHALDADSLAAAIGRYPAAPLVFLLVHTVASLVFFPRTVLGIAAGVLFGAWWGTLWAALGSTVGAVAGFLLARYLNAGFVDLESMPRFGPMLLRAERGGWRAVAVLRLIPVIPHSLSNYALGLTRLNLGAYTLGSFVGQLPMTIACAQFGAAGEQLAAGKAGWIAPTLIGAVALAVTIIVPKLASRRS
jgi:uncharacterized membrane protein YdjX (TVP38/TMEM64 family)